MDMCEIRVKDPMVLSTLMLKSFDRRLVAVICWWIDNFGRITITEGWRKKKHPNDLHGEDPVRAIDARSWEFKNAEQMAKKCNEVWAYDPARPQMEVCVYHDTGQGIHFHIQVHPNTKRRS